MSNEQLGEKRDPMDIMQTILTRRSYRGPYLPEPVPREDLRTLVEAGLAAPSGCNKQTVQLLAVDDPAVLARIKSVIDPPVGETAPAAICVLSKPLIAYRDRCFAVQDYSAAIENILLAAHALGYASCWYEGHITDADRIGRKMADLLGVPEDLDLVCFLPIGRPAQPLTAPRKQPFEARAFLNGYGGEWEEQA